MNCEGKWRRARADVMRIAAMMALLCMLSPATASSHPQSPPLSRTLDKSEGLAQLQPDEPTAAAAACSRAYHASLQNDVLTHAHAAADALNTAGRAVAGAGGRWLFGPLASAGRSLPTALSGKGKRPREGHTREFDMSARERALFQLADPLVKARGQIAQLDAQSSLGSTARRVARDMRRYAAQPGHSALCSGAPEFIEHLQRQIATMQRQLHAAQKSVNDSLDLANERIQRAWPTSSPAQSSVLPPDPITTGATISRSMDTRAQSIEPLVDAVTRLMLASNAISSAGPRESPLRALFELNERREQELSAGRAARTSAIEHALGIVEAATYIGHAGALYSQIGDALHRAVMAARSAQRTHCTCPTIPSVPRAQ